MVNNNIAQQPRPSPGLTSKYHKENIFEVKNSTASFWKGKILWVCVVNTLVAHASTRIEDLICFHEALIRFSKLGFRVARGEYPRLQYEDYI